jgi:hypothetical protein
MPFVETIRPIAALPGGELELTGTGLGPGLIAEVSGVEAIVTLAKARFPATSSSPRITKNRSRGTYRSPFPWRRICTR